MAVLGFSMHRPPDRQVAGRRAEVVSIPRTPDSESRACGCCAPAQANTPEAQRSGHHVGIAPLRFDESKQLNDTDKHLWSSGYDVSLTR